MSEIHTEANNTAEIWCAGRVLDVTGLQFIAGDQHPQSTRQHPHNTEDNANSHSTQMSKSLNSVQNSMNTASCELGHRQQVMSLGEIDE